MKLQTGTLLEHGKYRIISSLGRGGFGITYLAEQVMAKRKVCIKEFFPKDYYKRDGDTSALILSSDGFAETMDKYKAKFIKEAQTIAALEHTNITHIFDVFEENGTAYYVMEYIEGESLSDIVKRRGALAEAKAVAYIRQVAAALEYIHHRQIMHLDVKPGNIMVRRDDDRAILIDFGLSKHYDDKSGEATSTTPVGVSHGFAPMEQYQQGGVKEFSPETDIYSLAASLYYLATGDIPPQAANIADEGLPELPSHLSSGVRNAIERSMETQRKRRPHSMAEFVLLLNDAPDGYNESTVIVPKVSLSENTVLNIGVNNTIKLANTPLDDNNHEAVDLGLSVKWATCNVGANKPDEYGNYFAWGETTTKGRYVDENCKTLEAVKVKKSSFFGLLKDTVSEYIGLDLGDISGDARYDAATANWGGDWRMPTKTEFNELRKKCSWEWVTRDGKSGYKVTSKKNGKSIFLPAAGYRDMELLYHGGSYGFYWSSTQHSENTLYASYLDFGSGCPDTEWDYCYRGRPIRPVLGRK